MGLGSLSSLIHKTLNERRNIKRDLSDGARQTCQSQVFVAQLTTSGLDVPTCRSAWSGWFEPRSPSSSMSALFSRQLLRFATLSELRRGRTDRRRRQWSGAEQLPEEGMGPQGERSRPLRWRGFCQGGNREHTQRGSRGIRSTNQFTLRILFQPVFQ